MTKHFTDRVNERMIGIDKYDGMDLTPIYNMIIEKANHATELVTYTNRNGNTENYVLVTINGNRYGVGLR